MSEPERNKFTEPLGVHFLKPGEPSPEDPIERAKRILRERRAAEAEAKAAAAAMPDGEPANDRDPAV